MHTEIKICSWNLKDIIIVWEEQAAVCPTESATIVWVEICKTCAAAVLFPFGTSGLRSCQIGTFDQP